MRILGMDSMTEFWLPSNDVGQAGNERNEVEMQHSRCVHV